MELFLPTTPFPVTLYGQKVTVTHRGWCLEHGPNSDDEINIIEKGRNYGWPNVIGKCNTPAEITFCTDSAVVEPVKTWTPTLAVAGIDYYSHPAMPELNNSILLTNLKEADLRVLKLNPDGTQIVSEIVCLNNIFGRLRDLCVSPGGKIYIATSNHDGRGFPSSTDDRIIEIAPQTLAIHPAAKKDTPSFFPNPFSALAVLDLPSPETWKLTLCDITGREIRPAVSHKGNSLILHRENLLPGIYLYRLESGEGSIVRGKIRVE
jgi:aldose sugar dehydrogenase